MRNYGDGWVGTTLLVRIVRQVMFLRRPAWTDKPKGDEETNIHSTQ